MSAIFNHIQEPYFFKKKMHVSHAMKMFYKHELKHIITFFELPTILKAVFKAYMGGLIIIVRSIYKKLNCVG